MRNIIISIFVYFILATVIILAIKPAVHNPISINNTNMIFSAQSFSDTKNLIVNNVKNINKTNIEPQKAVSSQKSQSEQTREAYMNKLKERAQKEYGDDYYQSGAYISEQKNNDFQNAETQQTKSVKTLTEEEEIIAWNKWHADIATELLKRGNINHPELPIKEETRIGYSFIVNYKGEISSISIDYVNPQSEYTNVSKLWIPILQSMNHDPLLKFPEGTRRTRNKFSNRIRVSWNGRKYATPNDFNDYERIKYSSSR